MPSTRGGVCLGCTCIDGGSCGLFMEFSGKNTWFRAHLLMFAKDQTRCSSIFVASMREQNGKLIELSVSDFYYS